MKLGILWDLDGTLLDTLQDIADATNYILTENGYASRTTEEIRSFVGNGAGVLIRQAANNSADAPRLLRDFQLYYQSHCQNKTAPYPGVTAALDTLGKIYPMAIVSNKPDGAVKELCSLYFPGIYARGESADCPRKPAPDMIQKAMDAIGADCCIYIGDSEVDVQTARNAGCPCLSVLWGFRDREEIVRAGGTWFCETPEQLPEIIQRIAGEYHGK